MEFRILGPIQVLDHERKVDLGPPQQRALLALLIINANRVVTTDRILHELWGDSALGKENALWVYVSRLRSALEPDRTDRGQSSVLITRDHGYSLTVDPASIDGVQFERATEKGRSLIRDDPAAASQVLARGLEMWRGSAYEEYAYRDFAHLEIVRLESLRVDALQSRIEADLRRGKATELVAELEGLRSQHPMNETFVSQLMLALYQGGRQAEALRAFERFRRELDKELGLEPSPELRRLEEQLLLHDTGLRVRLPVIGRVGMTATSVTNPFKGLRSFGEDDAKEFFGRDRLIADIAKRIRENDSLIALVGPSGSGKSSVLRAGLIPALRKEDVGGDANWLVAQMVPGAHPFAELEAALLHSSLDVPESLSEFLEDPEKGALRAALRVLPDDRSSLLLVIDQFEELFTLSDPDERDQFIANLVPIVDDPHGRVTVVLGLRASFYDRPLAYPEFGSRLGGGVINVVPLTPDEFEEAAQKPAEAVGVFLSPSLLTALLTDVVGRPGSLPLFQYALTELFDRRRGEVLQLDDYREIGGVNGVLTRKADDLYGQLAPEEKEAAKQLLLRAVTIADNGEWGRRRVPASEIVDLSVDLVAMQNVIESFAANHLLTLDRDSITASPTVEVAHEALLTEWGLLEGWIEIGQEDVKRYTSLSTALNEWIDSGRHPDYLLSGSRLEGYEEWASSSTLDLTIEQSQFLRAGIEAREHAADVEQERVSLVEEAGRRARFRLWALVAATTLLVGVGLTLLFVAFRAEPFSVAIIAPSVAPYESSLVATGIARAERELPVEIDFRRRVASLEDEYRSLAEAGTDLIFIDPGNSGWGYVVEVIAEFPETAFAVVDGVVPPEGAMATYIADEDGGFIAGAAAALTTESGVVGFVGSRQSETTERWRAGFEAGVRAVDAGVDVLAIYIGDDATVWQDVEGASVAADRLFRQNADVVLAFAEDANLGVIEAAWSSTEESGLHRWVIGSGSDWSVEVADHLKAHVLTSAFKRWDVAIFETTRRFTDDEFEPGVIVLGLGDGATGLAHSIYVTDEVFNRIGALTSIVLEKGNQVPVVPAERLEPPPGMEAAQDLTVIWDGEDCRYMGASSFDASTAFRVNFTNDSLSHRQFWALHSNAGSFDVPVEVLVGPMSSHVGYMEPGPGVVEVNCGPDLRGGAAVDPRIAATLVLE